MIPKWMQIQWTPRELDNVVQKDKYETGSGMEELIHHLNVTTKLPTERVAKLEMLPNMGGMIITFGDGSGVTMMGEPLTRFLTEYIQGRESFITIMEHNRKQDPRVTGEFTRLQEELRLANEELKQYEKRFGPL